MINPGWIAEARNSPSASARPARWGRFVWPLAISKQAALGFKTEFNGIGGLRTYMRTRAGPSPARLPPRAASARPPSWGRFFLGGIGSWRRGAARWVVVYQPKPAAVGSAFWPRGAIQPVPGLFVGPTGNSVAPGDSRARVRAVALGRFGATHRRGVGSSTQTDQETQGQNRSHRVCSIRSTDRERIIRVRDSTSAAIRVLQSDHVRTLLMKPPPPAITASTSWLTALRA